MTEEKKHFGKKYYNNNYYKKNEDKNRYTDYSSNDYYYNDYYTYNSSNKYNNNNKKKGKKSERETKNKVVEKEIDYLKEGNEKDETKNLLYEPKDNIKESKTEPKIEEEKISDNKEKPKKIKKIKKKDVAKILLGNPDDVENKISLNNKDCEKKMLLLI